MNKSQIGQILKEVNVGLKDEVNGAVLITSSELEDGTSTALRIRGKGELTTTDKLMVVISFLGVMGIEIKEPKDSAEKFLLMKLFHSMSEAYDQIRKEVKNSKNTEDDNKTTTTEDDESKGGQA